MPAYQWIERNAAAAALGWFAAPSCAWAIAPPPPDAPPASPERAGAATSSPERSLKARRKKQSVKHARRAVYAEAQDVGAPTRRVKRLSGAADGPLADFLTGEGGPPRRRDASRPGAPDYPDIFADFDLHRAAPWWTGPRDRPISTDVNLAWRSDEDWRAEVSAGYVPYEVVDLVAEETALPTSRYKYGASITRSLLAQSWTECQTPAGARSCFEDEAARSQFALHVEAGVERKVGQTEYAAIPLNSFGDVDERFQVTAIDLALGSAFRTRSQTVESRIAFTYGLDAVDPTQPSGPPDHFKYFAGEISLSRDLAGRNGHRIDARLAAQYSNDVLMFPHEFAIGGVESVRGYREEVVGGRRGAAGSLEYSLPLEWLSKPDPIRATRFGVFVDVGYASGGGGTDLKHATLASAGLSLELDIADRVSASIFAAQSFDDVDPGYADLIAASPIGFRVTLRR